ncbi:RNA polymerase subunit sigma-70 [Streptomyces sp. NPDC096205]|uniref:RNA polymerase subunit sigma-70 n=1 Tax=Streptomyces sp. NPDC096205 TaxID=3366081 RepID=UPI0038013E60
MSKAPTAKAPPPADDRADGLGAEADFRDLVTAHRAQLHLHCYRMLGSLQDAEDLVQETLLAAWRARGSFEGRASLRTWLYRIATNRCLNELRDRSRRPRVAPAAASLPEPTRYAEPLWLEPYPDALLEAVTDGEAGPSARYELREEVGLAYLTALHLLPPRQRAAVLLCDGLGFSLAETAAMLGGTDTSVKGALQRARATLRTRPPSRGERPSAGSAQERRVAELFARAVEAGDIDGIVALLTDDAWLSMPPQPQQYQGPAAIGEFLRDRALRRGFHFATLPTRANGFPAFGCYRPDATGSPGEPYGLLSLALTHDRARGEALVTTLTWFCDTRLLAAFGLPAPDGPTAPTFG